MTLKLEENILLKYIRKELVLKRHDSDTGQKFSFNSII